MLRVAGMAERWRHKAQKDALNHGGVWLNACIALTLNILTWCARRGASPPSQYVF